jgi:uncharacterized protein (TIGR02246 family)
MKRAVFAVLLACALVAPAPLLAAGAAGDGLHSVDEAWTKAMLANDPAACAALYADDAVLVLPGSGAIKGKKAILEAYAGWLKDVKVTEAVISDAQYRSAGSFSSGWGAWKVTTVKKSGGAPTTETGTWTAVAVKKNGAWKYAADHASADPAPGK